MKTTQMMSAALLLLSGNTSGSAPLNCAQHQSAAFSEIHHTKDTEHQGNKGPRSKLTNMPPAIAAHPIPNVTLRPAVSTTSISTTENPTLSVASVAPAISAVRVPIPRPARSVGR